MDTTDKKCPDCGRPMKAITILDNAWVDVTPAQGELTYTVPGTKRSFWTGLIQALQPTEAAIAACGVEVAPVGLGSGAQSLGSWILAMNITVDRLYNDLWAEARPGFEERLGTSLSPRAPEMLDARFAALGVASEDTVLDAGCREASYAVQFAQQFGCRVVALDPMPRHLECAQAKVAEGGVGRRVTLLQGRMEEIPLDNDTIDHIWCRDVLNLVDLQRSLAECFRVLRAGGTMLTYQNFGTSLMEPQEAERMYAAMAIRPENMSRGYFEQRVRSAGFHIRDVEPIGSEWRECGIEQGWRSMDPLILRMCRMRRLEEELVREYGRHYFEAAYGAEQWLVYQALGKLCPMIHILEKPGATHTMPGTA